MGKVLATNLIVFGSPLVQNPMGVGLASMVEIPSQSLKALL
jgi:hypothetical protein